MLLPKKGKTDNVCPIVCINFDYDESASLLIVLAVTHTLQKFNITQDCGGSVSQKKVAGLTK